MSNKTKQLVIYYRKNQPMHNPVIVNGTAVESVQSTKFLDVHVSNNLSWSLHIPSLAKKAHHWIHFVQQLKRAHLNPSILTILQG